MYDNIYQVLMCNIGANLLSNFVKFTLDMLDRYNKQVFVPQWLIASSEKMTTKFWIGYPHVDIWWYKL